MRTFPFDAPPRSTAFLLGAVLSLSSLTGCGGHGAGLGANASTKDIRTAKERPPVVLISREGDPSGALAVAVTTAGIADRYGAEPAVALSGVLEGRLLARGVAAKVTPQWDGFRVVVLVQNRADAEAKTGAIRDALLAPIGSGDLAAAKKKLAALARRPLPDAALTRWATCTSTPYTLVERAGKSGADLTAATLESFRRESHGTGRVAFGVAGPRALGEAVAQAIKEGPAWRLGRALAGTTEASRPSLETYVYQRGPEPSSSGVIVHVTMDVPSSRAAVATADALGDPAGPLATRLATLEMPFRLREITGAAHPTGGCVGIVLESAPASSSGTRTDAKNDAGTARRVADAVALVHAEAEVHRNDRDAANDGLSLARRAGDPRDAAERAAWWALVDSVDGGSSTEDRRATNDRGSVALGVPGAADAREPTPVVPSREALGQALTERAKSWKNLVVEGRSRVEPGQGEAWILVASPCGTRSETDADAGLTALFVTAAAELTKTSPDVQIEPWIAADGAGLLVHGPARSGESPEAHARRLADRVAESIAATPLTTSALTAARAALLERSANPGSAAATLAGALAPGHVSWVLPVGKSAVVAQASDASILARAQALRAGPWRTAVLANVDGSQGTVAVRATDRWIERSAESSRTCQAGSARTEVKAATYAAESRAFEGPDAWLAFPFPSGDKSANAGAQLVAAALDGPDGLLASTLSGQIRSASATVLGWPDAPALVVRVVSTEASLDGAVTKTRELLARLHEGTPPNAFDRAPERASRAATVRALDPRARIVATWRGEPLPSFEPTASTPTRPVGPGTKEDARAFARRYLGETSMVVVATRSPRSKP